MDPDISARQNEPEKQLAKISRIIHRMRIAAMQSLAMEVQMCLSAKGWTTAGKNGRSL